MWDILVSGMPRDKSKYRESNRNYMRARRAAEPELRKAENDYAKARYKSDAYKFIYGLTRDEVRNIWLSQCGCCAACNKELAFPDVGTHLDHDHETGQIRGVLCSGCNRGLGFFEDSVARLEAALVYLKRYR